MTEPYPYDGYLKDRSTKFHLPKGGHIRRACGNPDDLATGWFTKYRAMVHKA